MRSAIPNILNAFDSAVWAIEETKWLAIREFLYTRSLGKESKIEAGARPTPKIAGRIAVLPLDGCIAHHAGMEMEISGGTSTVAFGKAFDDAVANRDIGAIVIDCNSPGGTVEGVPELAEKIFKARGTKPIYAIANANMNSAAYWICSAADQVFATPSANVGSIGVFTVHTDTSKMEADLGVKRTVISAGKYKSEAAPGVPLTDAAENALQDRVDEVYGMFSSFVAKARGASLKSVQGGFGEGRSISAKQALEAGMIDKIATFEDVVSDLAAKTSNGGVSRFAAAVAPASIFAAEPGESFSALTGRVLTLVRSRLKAEGGATCPKCGGAMQDGKCTECDYTEPESIPGTDEGPEAAARRGAPAAVAPIPASQPAHQARSQSMSDLDTAQRAEAAVTAAIKAEKDRVRDISALCADHKIDATQAATWISSDISVAAVSREILNLKKAETSANSPVVRVGADREAEKPFKSFGEQMVAAVQAGIPGRRVDPRLARVNQQAMYAGTPSGMNESVGSEGGYFIQPELLPGVIDPVYAEDPILSRVTRIPIGAQSSGVKYNVVDETSRVNGSRWGGITMAWAAEADAGTASKPKLRQMQLDLKKLIGLAYLTDELTQDAPAAEALLNRAFQAELGFMLGAAIFKGTGSGQPQGILNSGALVSQAIESTQTIANSASFLSLNVSKMLSRVPASLWGEVIWLYNQELLPYLLNATTGTNGTIPVFIAAGGMTNRPFDTILGRPAFGSELCEAVGTPGDILCVVPSQYHMADKGGAQQATSLHVRFIYDEMTLRVTYRTDGAPVWKTTVTPYKGANARSPFVALATRS
jgi:HK97 family phage major capsid protein